MNRTGSALTNRYLVVRGPHEGTGSVMPDGRVIHFGAVRPGETFLVRCGDGEWRRFRRDDTRPDGCDAVCVDSGESVRLGRRFSVLLVDDEAVS